MAKRNFDFARRAKDKNGTTWNVRERSLDDYEFAIDWASRHDFSSSTKPGKFTAHTSLAQYRDILRNGDPSMVKDVEGLDGLCTDESERLVFVPEVAGAFPHVPRYLSGHPQNMLQPRMQSVEHARGLTLVIDSSFNCSVSGETVLRYAQQVMRLVAWLSAERIDAAIYSVITMDYYSGGNTVYPIRIRDLGQVIQPERIAAIVHPCWLRRAFFAMAEYECYELKDKASRDAVEKFGGYGHAVTPTLAMLDALLPDAESIILLPKPGDGDPMEAVQETLNLKLKRD